MAYFLEYDEKVDFVKKHFDWIKEHKLFVPKGGRMKNHTTGANLYPSYLVEMEAFYRDIHVNKNKIAYVHYKDDVFWEAAPKKSATEEANILFGITKKEEHPAFFITFNFDENKFDSQKVLKDVSKLIELSWIVTCQGAFEYYTKYGGHPHFMMVITVNKYSNKIKNKMFESRLAKYCKGNNFIDVKRCQDYHNDYVLLDKSSSKQEFLHKDELWRIEQNLPHEIKK